MNALPLIRAEEHLTRKNMKHLIKICIYLCKMNMMSYDIIKDSSKLVLGASTLFVALKVMHKISPSFPVKKLISKV
jgi:hypothetical protein